MNTTIKCLLFFFSFLLLDFLFACKKDDISSDSVDTTIPEVRLPHVEKKEGKVLLTWIDPYISDLKEILVKDLQSNNEILVPKGVQKAEFALIDENVSSLQYEIKVRLMSGEKSVGVIVRFIKSWAQKTHPVLDYNTSLSPESGMFFKNELVSRVHVFDIRNDESISKLASAVMQGVLNQEKTLAYLLWKEQDRVQLNDAGADYVVQPLATTSMNRGFASLYNMYKDQFKCLVLWTESEDWSWSLAQMICAQEKGVPVTEELKKFIEKELSIGELEVKDIRGKWSSRAEAYDWALENLADKCHDKLIFSGGLRSDYKNAPWTIYDYAAAAKGFVFWLDEEKQEDKDIMVRIFKKMKYPVGSSVFGYGMNSNGDELNKIINIYNVGFVVSDYYANGSYWCSFPSKAFQQRKGVAAELKAGKIYVAISLSDGDNIQFDANSLYRIFKEGKKRGEVPVGVTMAPGLQELNPKLLEFFYKNLTPNDELTAGPCGFQFIYGDQYAKSGKYEEWIEMNRKWTSAAGFHTSHLWLTNNQSNFKLYMEGSGVNLVLDGSDRTNNEGASTKYINGVVRLNQGFHCRKKGDVYRDLMSISPSSKRPLFRHIYPLTEFYGHEGGRVVIYERLIEELERVEKERPNTYVYMLPMDLAASIKRYIDEGGVY